LKLPAALSQFVALYDLGILYRLVFANHVKVPDSLPGSAVDLMEANPALRAHSRKQLDPEGNKRDLQLTRPKWTTGHSFSQVFGIPSMIRWMRPELKSFPQFAIRAVLTLSGGSNW
jgi:hypothetical protein